MRARIKISNTERHDIRPVDGDITLCLACVLMDRFERLRSEGRVVVELVPERWVVREIRTDQP